MYMRSFLYSVLIFCVYGCTSGSEDIDDIYVEEPEPEQEIGIVNGLYAVSFFDEQTYNTVSATSFRDNLLSYYPAYAFEFKDSLLVDVLEYPDVKHFWNIDTNKRALHRFSGRRFATTEFSTRENSDDSLKYITYLELADPKVIKIKYRDPSENSTRYAFARLLEGEDTTTYISDYYSNTGFLKDEIYSKLDAWDYKSLLDGFIADAERHGVDLSYVDKQNSNLVLQNSGPAAAWVTGETGCDLNRSKIYFINEIWDNLGIYDKNADKLIIMWHELGHDLLNYAHWNGGGQIMTSSVGPRGSIRLNCQTGMYDLNMNSNEECTSWERAVDDFFEHFREYQETGVWGEYQNNCG